MGQDPDPILDPQDPPADDPPADPKPDPVDRLDEDALRAELKKTREEAARHRIAAREASARAKEYEDQNKTEAQKLQERAEAAEAALAKAERNALVASVALSKGLTEAQAKRLIGSTKEELEADADELLSTFGSSTTGGQDPPRTTRERLRPGAVPSAEEEENDPKKLAAQVPRRY
jgi:hypothetical protein